MTLVPVLYIVAPWPDGARFDPCADAVWPHRSGARRHRRPVHGRHPRLMASLHIFRFLPLTGARRYCRPIQGGRGGGGRQGSHREDGRPRHPGQQRRVSGPTSTVPITAHGTARTHGSRRRLRLAPPVGRLLASPCLLWTCCCQLHMHYWAELGVSDGCILPATYLKG